MASLFKVKALYDFEAKEEDDLGFSTGQVIDITEEIDDNWLEGRYTDGNGDNQNGIFPREFVEKYEPPVPSRPTRPARPKQETVPVPTPAAVPEPVHPIPPTASEASAAEPEPPALPAQSKPQPPPVETSMASSADENVRSPQSAASTLSPPVRAEPPPATKVTPADPAPASSKKPPPIAPKSNAFKDRIAAFNQPAAAPVIPMVPGGSKPNTFIRKPFVAPPPMSNSYVPPPKIEQPVHKPYIREEDPEIRQRQEEDRAAAEAAGLTSEQSGTQQEEDEDAPKPTSLKERIARLQQQQLEQAQRRAEGGPKEKKKAPFKKASEHEDDVEPEAEGEEMARERSTDTTTQRQSLDASRERPRVSSVQRQPREPLSPIPTVPDHELVSDGHEADQSGAGDTDDAGTIGPEDSDDTQAPPPPPRAAAAPAQEPDVGEEEGATDEGGEGEEDDDDMDEETRRRLELRERMAKMSGGMGMAGMFGPPGGMPMPGGAPSKKRSTKDKKPSEDDVPSSPPQQQRVPMVPVPGMNRVQSPESDRTQMTEDNEPTGIYAEPERRHSLAPSRNSIAEERGAAPPLPSASRPSMDRAVPPVPGGRAVPPPPPAAPMSPGPGSESDDEASIRPPKRELDTPDIETPMALPIRSASGAAPLVPGSESVRSLDNKRVSYIGNEPSSTVSDKRASRPPPPIPQSPLTSRPPPPLPPGIPSRQPTQTEEDTERGESDYEGDYDTDIASSAKHKDALKAHVREPSLDDSTTTDETPMSAPPPPPPHTALPRAVPPPPPAGRPSIDTPRAPPPMPPTGLVEDDDEYDPYRYDEGRQRGPPAPMPSAVPVVAPPMPPREPEMQQESSADDFYATSPPRRSVEQRTRAVPVPPPQEAPLVRALPRQSLDVQRSNTIARRSMDGPRPGENGQIANDLDLGENTTWWTAPQPLPPVLQSRNGIDILSECEESTTSKRGGRTTIVKDIYVLFIDYSQTIITVQYDSQNAGDVKLEQRHLPPPAKLRQDQLETYWQKFGSNIAKSTNELGHSKKDTTVGDGSPGGFVSTLVKSQKDALQPVGNRAYGSLVYANLANASTMQFDEIRPGDIVTLRNARFEGTHGAMKHKYKQDYGSHHVAVVEEWDGTRRAIRGWEQGREKAKIRSEKFRLGDLRSGEVKVWRIVGRDWVDWQS
ncbi:hypothetical protein DOTSEDRAFT_75797 [Dothistroma septosporum NZE10]|uniref:SH3 domain-containing protein n=1 Tax=Dothistroma septosporum (strain NZE10 / CBS 128990) TaxID=675120 RepID=N1PD60_DOTSN|nr:hypothetical protein DOTSEDRAFT_75797 [Dothistroma septosporum NZE10]